MISQTFSAAEDWGEGNLVVSLHLGNRNLWKNHIREKKIKTKTNHLNQNRILKGLDSFKYSIYWVKKMLLRLLL